MAVVVAAYQRSTAAAFGLGQALAEAGRAEEAAAAFRSALEAVPADPSLDDEQREAWRERIRTALNETGG